MYIRFESSVRDDCARSNQGLFCAAYDIWYDRHDLHSTWQVHDMRQLLDWFNDNLSEPQQMFYRPNQKAEISGVCWFRAASGRFVTQARYLAWLIEDLGQPIVEKRSIMPGRILWADPHQIVATSHL